MDKKAIEHILKEVHLYLGLELDFEQNYKDQDVDSLDAVEIIMEMEKRLNIHLSDETLVNINTPNDLVNLIFENTRYKEVKV